MSIDNKIVRMKFDNAQFEANVSKSMSTLDKLKEKLKFKDASQDISKLQTDVNHLSFVKLMDNVDALSKRFSTMGIVGMNVINKLTDGAINAAKRIEQATFGQIRSGGWSRAMNLANAQFMVEGLKLDWDELLKAIDYGVQDTAYGLDAAAKAASSLAASGVDFKESVKGANDSLMHTSLRAISGVAAMTNSTYEDISRIFTTVAGNGRLMGDQLLQLSGRGLNVAADLGKALGKSEAEVRKMVSAGEIDFKTFATAMDNAFGEHAKDANKTFSGSLSNLKAALSRIGAIFATPVIEKTNIAFNAMTKRVNEVKNALSDLKDENGVVIQARFATHFAEMWDSAMNVAVKAINAIDLSWFQKLADAADNATVRLKGFFDYINGKFGNATDEVGEASKEAQKATKELILTQEEYDAAHFIMFGKRSYSLSGDARKKWLKEQGLSYANVQGYINKVVAAGWDESKVTMKIAGSTDELAESATEAGEEIKKAGKEVERYENTLKIFSHIGNSIKNVFTNVKMILGAVKNAFSDVFDFGGFLRRAEKFTGKIERLTKSLILSQKTIDRIRIVFTVFFSAIKLGITIISTFVGFVMDIVSGFFMAKKAVDDVTASVDKSIGFFDSLFVIFKKIGEGLRTYADNFTELLTKIGKTDGVQRLKKVLTDLFGATKRGIDTGIRPARTEFAKFAESFKMPSIDDIANGIGWVADKIAWFVEHIPIWADAVKDFAEKIIEKGQMVIDWVKEQDIAGKVKESFTSGFTLDDSTKEKISGFFTGIVDFVKETIENLNWDKVKEIGRVALLAAILFNSARTLYHAANMFKSIAGMTQSITGFFKGLNKTLSAIPRALNMASLGFVVGQISGFVAAIAGLILVVGNMPMDDLLQALFAIGVLAFIISKMFKYIAQTIPKDGGKVFQFNLGPYVGMALFVTGLGIGIKLIITAIREVLEIIYKPIKGTENAKGKGGKTAGGTGVFAGLVVVGMIMAGITAMAIVLMREVAKQSVFGSFDIQTNALLGIAVMIFALGVAMKAIASAMKTMSGLSIGTVLLGLLTLGAMFGGMWALMQSVSKLDKGLAWTAAGIMIVFTLAMQTLLTKVLLLSLFGWGKILPALTAIAGITGAMAGIMFVIYKTLSQTKDTKGIALVVASMGATVFAIAQAIKIVMKTLEGFDSNEDAMKSLRLAVLALAGTVIIFGAVIGILVHVAKDSNDILVVAGSLLMMSGAMLLIAMAIDKLAGVKLNTAALITLGAIIAIFAGMGIAAAKVKGFAEGIFAVGTAFLFLGAGLVLAGVGFGVMSKTLPDFAKGFEMLAKTISKHIAASIIIIVAIVAACVALSKAVEGTVKVLGILKKPIAGLVSLFKSLKDKLVSKEDGKKGLFTKLLEKLEKGGKQFLAWFKKQTPLMKAGIIAFATMIMGTIIELAPRVIRTILEVIFIIIDTLITYMDAIVNRLLAFIIKLISALAVGIAKNSAAIVRALRQVFEAIVVLIVRVIAGIVRGIAGWFGFDDIFGIAATLDGVADGYTKNIEKMSSETDADLKIMDQSFTDVKKSIDDQYGSAVNLGSEYDELKQKTNDLTEAQNDYNSALEHGQTHSVEWYRQHAQETGEKSWFQEEQNAITKYINLMKEREEFENTLRNPKNKKDAKSEDEIANAMYAWDLSHQVDRAKQDMDEFQKNLDVFNNQGQAQFRTLQAVAETYKGLFGEELDISKYGSKEWEQLIKQQPEIQNMINHAIAGNLVDYEKFKDQAKEDQKKLNEALFDREKVIFILSKKAGLTKEQSAELNEKLQTLPKEIGGLLTQYLTNPEYYALRLRSGAISESMNNEVMAFIKDVAHWENLIPNLDNAIETAYQRILSEGFNTSGYGQITDKERERVEKRLYGNFESLKLMPSDVIGSVIEYLVDKDSYEADVKAGLVSSELNEQVRKFVYNSLYGYDLAYEKITSGGHGAAIATREDMAQYLQKIPDEYRSLIINALVDKEGFAADETVSSEVRQSVFEYINRLLDLDYKGAVSPDKITADLSPYLDGIKKAFENQLTGGVDVKSELANSMAARMKEAAVGSAEKVERDGIFSEMGDTVADQLKEQVIDPANTQVASGAADIGNNFALGLIKGMKGERNQNEQGLKQTTIALVDRGMIEAARKRLREASPSKVMAEIGSFATEGLIVGLTDKATALKDTATGMIGGLVSQFSNGGSDVSKAFTSMLGNDGGELFNAFSGGYQMDMGIQPVLDSSSIMNGADSIGAMLGNQSLMINGFSGELAADISSLDSRNSQGVNEIRQLRNEMSDMSDALRNMQIYLDTGALVGGIADPLDNRLGARAIYARRGN